LSSGPFLGRPKWEDSSTCKAVGGEKLQHVGKEGCPMCT
jgi:hypothetical protein